MAVSAVLSSSQITSLIQQASAAYQAPAATLQVQEKPLQSQISALGQVQGALSSLQSALASLADVQTLTQRSVTASPNGVVEASATNAAAVGKYSLSGIQLAEAENLISSGSASASGTLGAGTIAIKLGDGDAVTIDIASDQSSLTGIAAAISAANVGVQATIVYDGTNYRLVLTGEDTGSANAFTVTGSGALSGLSYYAGASGSSFSATQTAEDASFSLNGISITSGSNTISGVVQGLTLTLAASGSATVNVTQSVSALDSAAQGLVGALNGALGTISKFSSYSPTAGAGPLLGNVGLQIIRANLLNAIANPIGALGQSSATYNSLSSVGISITSGGTISFDDSKFVSAAQSDYSTVAGLLGEIGRASNSSVSVQGVGAATPGTYAVAVTTNSGGSVTGTVNGQAASGIGGLLVVTDAGAAQGLSLAIAAGVTGSLGTVTVSQGLFGSLSSLLTAALEPGTGSVSGQIDRLNDTLASMDKQVASLLQQAQQQTQILTRQFTLAQATLSQLASVSSFLNTYFNLPSGGLGE